MLQILRLVSLVILLAASALAAEPQRLEIVPSQVRVTAGGSAALALSATSQAVVVEAVSLRAESYPLGPYPISVGKPVSGEGLFLATPPTIAPGAYSLTVTLADEAGLEHQGSVEVLVEPLPPVPQTARAPVVLVNGFDFGTLFGGECELSEDSTATFGRLEEFLTADGAPVVFFDNCRFGTPPIEVLGQELGNVIAMLEHPDGSPVTRLDIVAFSMGTLVARSYLAGKQLEPDRFAPPADPKVSKAVLVAGEHFGAPLASGVDIGEQVPALQPGSQFLWDLATWHQGFDDLREVDALAVAGTGSRDGQGDGVAPLAGASLSSTAFFGLEPARTRILPACHNSLSALLCDSDEVLMAVDSEEHPTGRIIRSFLADTNDWQQIGETPPENDTLPTNGGAFFALKDAADAFVDDVSRVVAFDPRDESTVPDQEFQKGPASIFFRTLLPSLTYVFDIERPSGTLQYTADVAPLGSSALLAKIGPAVARLQPAAGAVATLSVAADSLVSIFGRELADDDDAATSLPLPTELAGTTVTANDQPLGLLYAGPGQINAYLPADLSGLLRVTVMNAAGEHTINVLLDAAVPALFSQDGSGQGPAAALHAGTARLVTEQDPAAIGGFVSLFLTGLGATFEENGLMFAVRTPEVFVGGVPAPVLFAGSTGEFAGLNQINIEVPEGAPTGPRVPVVVQSGKRVSNEVTLAIE